MEVFAQDHVRVSSWTTTKTQFCWVHYTAPREDTASSPEGKASPTQCIEKSPRELLKNSDPQDPPLSHSCSKVTAREPEFPASSFLGNSDAVHINQSSVVLFYEPPWCLENPMDGGAWKAAVHGVTRSRTRLSDFTFIFHFHALEKEMATHSSVLAWRIPGTGELGGLPSLGSHRVGHDWSDLAAGDSDGKMSCLQCGRPGFDPWVGRSSGEGNGNPLQYSCLENPTDRGALWATVHGVAKSQTRLSDFTFSFFLSKGWSSEFFLPSKICYAE